MSKRVNIPDCCEAVFFAGDTKIIKFTVEGIEDLTTFGVHFKIDSPYWTMEKDRLTGITTVVNDIFIRFEDYETAGQAGEWNYRVWISSPEEKSTVAYGVLTLI